MFWGRQLLKPHFVLYQSEQNPYTVKIICSRAITAVEEIKASLGLFTPDTPLEGYGHYPHPTHESRCFLWVSLAQIKNSNLTINFEKYFTNVDEHFKLFFKG